MNEIKIFNEQGFLTKDGATFVNDGFAKELHNVVKTAQNPQDVMVICSILKGLVDEHCSQVRRTLTAPKLIEKPKLRLIKGGKSE